MYPPYNLIGYTDFVEDIYVLADPGNFPSCSASPTGTKTMTLATSSSGPNIKNTETITTPGTGATQATPTNPTGTTSATSKPKVGSIVGGVVGSLTLIKFLGLWGYKRRKKYVKPPFVSPQDNPTHVMVSLFVYNPASSSSDVNTTERMLPVNNFSQIGFDTSVMALPMSKSSRPGPPVIALENPFLSFGTPLSMKSAPPPPPAVPSVNESQASLLNSSHVLFPGRSSGAPVETEEFPNQVETYDRHPVVHQDSGLRLPAESVLGDIPPAYTAD